VSPLLSRVRIVLVRPHFAGNLGSVARVMANFGFRDLVLVDPIVDHASEDARRMATHGLPVLESCRVMATLNESLADCVASLATGGLAAGVERQTVAGSPREKLPFLIQSIDAGTVALVFGPEPHGLTNAEVSQCHGMIHIPTTDDCPSINLSHAVAMCLYEMSQLVNESISRIAHQPASHAELDRLIGHLRQAFEAINYIYGDKADQLMHGFRHIISRAQPSSQEVRLLHGLARQTLYISGKYRSESGEPPGDPLK
jgi:tRNA/rRNA methyltransferase